MSWVHRVAERAAAVTAAASLVACSGASHASPAMPGYVPPAASVRVAIPVRVAPPATGASAKGVSPAYFSTKAQSLTVAFFSKPHGTPAGNVTLANLSPSSSECTTSAQGTVCTIAASLAPGDYYCTVETYSQPNGHGPVLSIQEYIPLTVNADSSITTPPWTLWGVPHTIDVEPVMTPSLRRSGSTVTAFSLSRVYYTVSAYDQAGGLLVGPGLPAWTVASSNPAFAVTQPATTSGVNWFAVAPPGGGPFTTQLSLTASFPQSAIDFCRIVGANCSAPTQTLNALNVTADDWLTFAHDFQRTGYEAQRTGISTTTAAKLGLRWTVQVPNATGIYVNPAVYDGNVVVVTGSPAVVYDLSAIDGSVLWSRPIGAGSIKAATIDPSAGAHGLVFVGNRTFGAGGVVEPSTLYALNLDDGSIAWQTTVMGLTRGAEVVANGKLYVPTGGGDPPQCLNAGIQEVDEATGAIGWTWYVNGMTNPNGGGGVWGAVAYDGAHLIFGTGNVCQNSGNQPGVVQTADGAAALDLEGHLLASYVAWAQAAPNYLQLDYDTGSSVMIRGAGTPHETATFLNKNSSLYTFNVANLSESPPSAVLQQRIQVNPQFGYGQYASPTSDGTNIVVQTGAYPNSSPGTTARDVRSSGARRLPADVFMPHGVRATKKIIAGYHSYLGAFGPSGNALWSYETQTIMQGYAAIVNGVVIAPGDSAVVALAMNGNGTPLWSYPTAGVLDSSPSVVPSGVYIADMNGNVYAFSLPYSAGATQSARKRTATP